jgi:hypothetical protein
MEAMTTKSKYANFLNFTILYGFNIPKVVRNMETIGSSKAAPKGNVMSIKKLKYLSAVKEVVIKPFPSLIRNLMMFGKIK